MTTLGRWRTRVQSGLRRTGEAPGSGAATTEPTPHEIGPTTGRRGPGTKSPNRKKSRPGHRERGQLAGLESLVRPGPGRSVLILAHASQRGALAPWLEEFAGDRVCVVSQDEAPEWKLEDSTVDHRLAADLGKVNSEVRMMQALDVIVNLLPSELLPPGAENQMDLFATLFRYVKQHGTYVIDRRHGPTVSSLAGLTRWMQVVTASEDAERMEALPRLEAELARATGTVAVTRDLIVATKRTRHFVKLLDVQVNRVLPAREPSLAVTELERRPGGRFDSLATVVSHTARFLDETVAPSITYPELHLRHYEGRIALAGQTLMYTGHTILPDSFRWHLSDNPSNVRLTSVSRHFARVPSAYVPRRVLEGSYYQLDCAYPHHYGHLTTEVVSRLWGWDQAKREIPDLKAIFHLKPHSRRDPSLERALFTAYGIDESDIAWVNEPVWLRSVVSASPMWHNAAPHYVHPDMTHTWERLGRGLGADQPETAGTDRIFVSRGGGAKHRDCRNAGAVEEFFSSRGFAVVYPEEMSLGQQVATFRHARVVAGFGGSAMFNLMYAEHVETVILLNHEAYTARNEHLFTSLTGGEVHYFWSSPDIEHPDDGWSPEAFYASWEFDFERNGAELDEVLTRLG